MNKIFSYLDEICHERHPQHYKDLVVRNKYNFSKSDVRLIAYYLPQFHTFAENDQWWGKGFTEWTNVTKATPQFYGHYQPRLAGELGYYNLLADGTMERQIELAKMYGIFGFCFHFYMFNDRKRLLEKPLDMFLANKKLDMPFCLSYANENWTKKWDGRDDDILMKQSYGEGFISDLAQELKKYLLDSRYILLDERPLILIYRISSIPDLCQFTTNFREECRKCGIGEIYLCSVLFGEICDAREFGFDDNVEFPLHQTQQSRINDELELFNENFTGSIIDYEHIVKTEINKPINFPRFRGVMPSWDNEARKPGNGHCIFGSTPYLYQAWLQAVCYKTINERTESSRFVFINAWNEWAEGAYLEPDRRYGYAYLEATYQALLNQNSFPEINWSNIIDSGYRRKIYKSARVQPNITEKMQQIIEDAYKKCRNYLYSKIFYKSISNSSFFNKNGIR